MENRITDNELISDLKTWIRLSEHTEEPIFATHIFLQQVLELINRKNDEIKILRQENHITHKLLKDAWERIEELNEIAISKATKELVEKFKKEAVNDN